MSSRSLATVAGAVAVLLAAGGCGGTKGAASLPSASPTAIAPASTPPPVAGEWHEIAESPLSARAAATAAWTGEEVLVFGGHDRACEHSQCAPDSDDVLRDGAAYDPARDSWRRIAPAPVPVSYADTALAGDTLYVRVPAPAGPTVEPGPTRWFAYDIPADSWAEIWPGPESSSPVAVGGLLFADRWSRDGGAPFAAYDEEHDRWTDLPDDGLGPDLTRTGLGDSESLYSVAYEGDGAEDDTRAGLASYDPASETWTRLPDPPIGAVPRVVSGGRLIDPEGEYSAAYDPVARAWTVSPGQPALALGAGRNQNAFQQRLVGAAVVASPNLLLDSRTMTWTALPPHEALGGDAARHEAVGDVSAAWAGDRLFVWGGVQRWDGEAHEDRPDPVQPARLRETGWVWQP